MTLEVMQSHTFGFFWHLFIYLVEIYSSINAARSHLYEDDRLKPFSGRQFSDEG